MGWGFLAACVLYFAAIVFAEFGFDTIGLVYLTMIVGVGMISLGVSQLAEAKGHKGSTYFVLSIFLSPLVGLLLVWGLRDRRTDTPK